MLSGRNVDLTLVDSEDECIVWARLYNNLAEREEFDHTEMTSAENLLVTYRQNGFWSPGAGTLLIKGKRGQILGEISYTANEIHGVTLGYRLFERLNFLKTERRIQF